MKIGIISVNNAHNFGTTMQALGLKNHLESQGHQVQIVNYRNKDIEKSYRPGRILPGNTKKSKYKYFKKWVKEAVNKPYLPLRRHRFETFFDEKPSETGENVTPAKVFRFNSLHGYMV